MIISLLGFAGFAVMICTICAGFRSDRRWDQHHKRMAEHYNQLGQGRRSHSLTRRDHPPTTTKGINR